MSKIIWSGKLAYGTRLPAEFDAEICLSGDRFEMFDVSDGKHRGPLSPHDVDGGYWLRAVVALAAEVAVLSEYGAANV